MAETAARLARAVAPPYARRPMRRPLLGASPPFSLIRAEPRLAVVVGVFAQAGVFDKDRAGRVSDSLVGQPERLTPCAVRPLAPPTTSLLVVALGAGVPPSAPV